MNTITVAALAALINEITPLQLIDVRESHEHKAFNIGGINIPLSKITRHIDTIEKEIPVILYCRIGIRSQLAIQRLTEKFPFKNLYNLSGGTEAWQQINGQSKNNE